MGLLNDKNCAIQKVGGENKRNGEQYQKANAALIEKEKGEMKARERERKHTHEES